MLFFPLPSFFRRSTSSNFEARLIPRPVLVSPVPPDSRFQSAEGRRGLELLCSPLCLWSLPPLVRPSLEVTKTGPMAVEFAAVPVGRTPPFLVGVLSSR